MRTVSIRESARQAMERIAALTSETVSLHVPYLHHRVCIDVIERSQPIRRVVPLTGAITMSGPSYRFDQGPCAVAPELVMDCQSVSRLLGESPAEDGGPQVGQG
jgi:hypothetical protein